MSEWICESCINYPPSSCDGKPCCACDPYDPLMSCYDQRKPEYIDRHIARNKLFIGEHDLLTGEEIMEILDSVPLMDVLSVVRCRECVYYSEKSSMCRKWSKHGTVFTIPSGFCHKGKRIEDNNGEQCNERNESVG